MATRPNLCALSDFLTVGEAADFLGVSTATLRQWDRAGKLVPARHPLNSYRLYRREDLEAILRAANRSVKPGIEGGGDR